MKGLFITGTDTDAGKTYVSAMLIRAIRKRGRCVAPCKPVAAGAELKDGQWLNDDALTLIEAAGGGWDYAEVNPYCFEAPISPHLASADVNVVVELPQVLHFAERLAAKADGVIVEGAGGWLVPLAKDLDVADMALAFDLPVVLVVGLRLGCLNHARLSEFAIERSGAQLAGWIASQVDPEMQRVEENLQALRERLSSPCLGVLPWKGAGHLDVERLLALSQM